MPYPIQINDSESVKMIVKNVGSGSSRIAPAAIDVLGGIKPLYQTVKGSKVNRSGLVIAADGTAYVNVKSERGIARDGAGQIGINAATQAEVTGGTEQYKPVTPATLKSEFDRRNTYSTTPQQIGTWIDGTPVWRVAFKTALTSGVKNLREFHTFNILSIINDREAVKLVMGGFASIDDRTVIDNDSTELNSHGVFTWGSVNPDAEYISGYIDFITPASNIRTS